MSAVGNKRKARKKVGHMSTAELKKLIRTIKPELSRLSALVAYATQELARRDDKDAEDDAA